MRKVGDLVEFADLARDGLSFEKFVSNSKIAFKRVSQRERVVLGPITWIEHGYQYFASAKVAEVINA